jgi:hypothetical protein
VASLNIRGLDEETAARLKEAARARGVSVNRHALELLRRGLGLVPRRRTERHHDLDHLAGTWTAEEGEAFARALAPFEQVDEDLSVAATALELAFGLFTFDSHFRALDGLLSGSRPEDFLP